MQLVPRLWTQTNIRAFPLDNSADSTVRPPPPSFISMAGSVSWAKKEHALTYGHTTCRPTLWSGSRGSI